MIKLKTGHYVNVKCIQCIQPNGSSTIIKLIDGTIWAQETPEEILTLIQESKYK